jgi:hypothetical protein
LDSFFRFVKNQNFQDFGRKPTTPDNLKFCYSGHNEDERKTGTNRLCQVGNNDYLPYIEKKLISPFQPLNKLIGFPTADLHNNIEWFLQLDTKFG